MKRKKKKNTEPKGHTGEESRVNYTLAPDSSEHTHHTHAYTHTLQASLPQSHFWEFFHGHHWIGMQIFMNRDIYGTGNSLGIQQQGIHSILMDGLSHHAAAKNDDADLCFLSQKNIPDPALRGKPDLISFMITRAFR